MLTLPGYVVSDTYTLRYEGMTSPRCSSISYPTWWAEGLLQHDWFKFPKLHLFVTKVVRKKKGIDGVERIWTSHTAEELGIKNYLSKKPPTWLLAVSNHMKTAGCLHTTRNARRLTPHVTGEILLFFYLQLIFSFIADGYFDVFCIYRWCSLPVKAWIALPDLAPFSSCILFVWKI